MLFAMIVYGMLALALRALIDWLTYRILLVQRQAALATSMQADESRRGHRLSSGA